MTISALRRFTLRGQSESYELALGETVLGRSRGCEITLKDPSVSRQHAVLVTREDGVLLRDLSSSNGTLLNGKRLEGNTELHPSDRLTLGETTLELEAVLIEEDYSFAGLLEEADAEGPTATIGIAAAPPAAAGLGPVASVAPGRSAFETLHRASDFEKPSSGPKTPPAAKIPTALKVPASPAIGFESNAVEEAFRRLSAESSAPPAASPPAPPPPGASAITSVPDQGELLPSLDDLDLLAPSAMSATKTRPVGPAARSSAPSRAPRPGPMQGSPAGFGVRFAATLLDTLLVLILAFAGSLVGGGPFRPEGQTIFLALEFGVAVLMNVFGWNLWGTTPGKRLFSLYVCGASGKPGIPVGQAMLRFVGYLVSGLALGLGFLMIAFTRERRGLHDIIAGTRVGRWS